MTPRLAVATPATPGRTTARRAGLLHVAAMAQRLEVAQGVVVRRVDVVHVRRRRATPPTDEAVPLEYADPDRGPVGWQAELPRGAS